MQACHGCGMLLPTPNAEDVARFQAVYKAQYGTDLSTREALPLLTRLVQFYYLTGGHDAREQLLEHRKQQEQQTQEHQAETN